jgi:hypothetical protein
MIDDFDICDFANPNWDPEKLFQTLKNHVKKLRSLGTNKEYGEKKFNLAEFYLWFYSFKFRVKVGGEDLIICEQILKIFEKSKFIKKSFYNEESKQWTVWEILT